MKEDVLNNVKNAADTLKTLPLIKAIAREFEADDYFSRDVVMDTPFGERILSWEEQDDIVKAMNIILPGLPVLIRRYEALQIENADLKQYVDHCNKLMHEDIRKIEKLEGRSMTTISFPQTEKSRKDFPYVIPWAE